MEAVPLAAHGWAHPWLQGSPSHRIPMGSGSSIPHRGPSPAARGQGKGHGLKQAVILRAGANGKKTKNRKESRMRDTSAFPPDTLSQQCPSAARQLGEKNSDKRKIMQIEPGTLVLHTLEAVLWILSCWAGLFPNRRLLGWDLVHGAPKQCPEGEHWAGGDSMQTYSTHLGYMGLNAAVQQVPCIPSSLQQSIQEGRSTVFSFLHPSLSKMKNLILVFTTPCRWINPFLASPSPGKSCESNAGPSGSYRSNSCFSPAALCKVL